MPIYLGVEYKIHQKPAYPLHSGLSDWMKAHSVGLISIHTIEFEKGGFVDFYITRAKSDNGINRSMQIVIVRGYNSDIVSGTPLSMLKSFDDPKKDIILEYFMEIIRSNSN